MKISSLLFSLLLAACSLSGGAQTTPTSIIPPATETASPAPQLVLLLAPPESDALIAETAATLAGEYAAQSGMLFEQRTVLDANSLPSNLTKLIILFPDPGVATLAAAAPQASVIAIGFDPGNDAPNLIALPLTTGQGGEVPFIAGYVAALSADDWRVGMLYTVSSAAWVDDFLAGAEFFCGSCISVAPPYNEYPQAVQATDAQNWQAASDQLVAQSVRVVYLAPELEGSGAAQYLANFGVLLIGGGAPPADIAGSWLTSISVDPVTVLRQQLPLVLAGQPLGVASSITVTNANPALLSEARLTHIQLVITDLLNGFIVLPTNP